VRKCTIKLASGRACWYKFMPTTSGVWEFTSPAEVPGGSRDTCGVLRCADGSWFTSNDDFMGTLFSVPAILTGGTTYYLEDLERLAVCAGHVLRDHRGATVREVTTGNLWFVVGPVSNRTSP